MKKLITIAALALTAFLSNAQVPPPVDPGISNIVGTIDESVNLFNASEVEFRLGGVYDQQTGEAGTLLAVEKWDVFVPNLGFGAETITSNGKQAAEFAYVSYRKLLGNTAGSLFLGGGYDDLNAEAMGVVGARLERRLNKHMGAWTSVSYAIEPHASNSRGMVIGAGVSYAF